MATEKPKPASRTAPRKPLPKPGRKATREEARREINQQFATDLTRLAK